MKVSLVPFLFCVLVSLCEAKPPNIVLILTDDQGWNGLSVRMDPDEPRSASDFYQTPRLAKFAAEGMRFTRAYSAAPVCSPSRTSIIFGMSPAKTGVTSNHFRHQQNCDPKLALPNLIKRANPDYATAHYGKWHTRPAPDICGFDESDGPTGNEEGDPEDMPNDPKRVYELSAKAVDFMERQAAAKKPFYLQISHYADHFQFRASLKMRAKYASLAKGKRHHDAEFAGMNEDLDAGVGQVLDAIDRLGLRETTWVFFTSDNGFQGKADDGYDRVRHKAWPLSYAKMFLEEGGVRVPFVVRGPGVKAGAHSHVPVIGYDLLPTFLDLVKSGSKAPDNTEGGSLRSVLENSGQGTVTRPVDFFVFHYPIGVMPPRTALLQDNLKLIHHWKTGESRLFDLATDPSEANDLSAKMPKRKTALEGQMNDYLKRVKAVLPPVAKRKGNTLPRVNRKAAAPPVSGQPHVILIVADDLGWGDVGYHGSRIKTPNIDRLAKDGVQLSNFYAMPLCSPTRGALLTGKHPIRLGLQIGVVRPWAQHGLPLAEVTLPQMLKPAGYRTAMIGKWHLGHHAREYLPTERGFDYHYGHYNGAIGYFKHERDGGLDWHRNREPLREKGYATDLLAKDAIRIIESVATQNEEQGTNNPLFLYLPFNAPHTPLQAPEQWREEYKHYRQQKRQTYAAMVACLDDAIGQVLAAAEEHLDNTFIFFCSDNGGIRSLGSNGEFRDGKGSLYEGGIHVPAIAKWTGRLPAGETVNTPMHVKDLFPTILKLAGQTVPDGLDGRDILPAITHGAELNRESLLLNATPEKGAVRSGEWKLVHHRQDGRDQWELFNLNNDPSEENNLVKTHPRILARLQGFLEKSRSEAVEPLIAEKKPQNFAAPKIWGHFTE